MEIKISKMPITRMRTNYYATVNGKSYSWTTGLEADPEVTVSEGYNERWDIYETTRVLGRAKTVEEFEILIRQDVLS